MFGLPLWLIPYLALVIAVPGAWYGGRWHQSSVDGIQAQLEQAQAVNIALEKARDDAATITLKQVEATQRERDARKAVEAKTADLEAEALETEKRLAEFTCPAVVPPSDAPPAATAPPVLAPPMVGSGHPGDLDLDWVRRNFPPGRITRTKPAAASGRGK